MLVPLSGLTAVYGLTESGSARSGGERDWWSGLLLGWQMSRAKSNPYAYVGRKNSRGTAPPLVPWSRAARVAASWWKKAAFDIQLALNV